jgi:ABC-type Fe3+/spermidine/putrescine transport system ATPase subunit
MDTELGKIIAYSRNNQELKENQEVLCSVRPEAIQCKPETQDTDQPNTIIGRVELLTYLGEMVRYQILIDETNQMFYANIQNIGGIKVFKIGDKVKISFSEENVRLIPF